MISPTPINPNAAELAPAFARDRYELTLSEAVEPFLLYCRSEKQYATESLLKARECFDSWLVRHFGKVPISDIRPLDVFAFRQAMATRQLSVARQYSLLMTLKIFLKFCHSVLEISCLDPASIRLPKRPIPKVVYLTNQEVNALREVTDTSHRLGVRLRALIETLLGTGMRISELLSLNRDSISRSKNEALISGKGGKFRTVFFPGDALRWIDRYLASRTDLHPALFVTSGGVPERLRRGDVPRYFKALARVAGIQKHVTPHTFRHTYCTNLRNNGADISLIKDLAGHRDIQTTARYYLGSDVETLRDAVGRYLDYS
jgi:site-specific recombinase XerD